MAKKHLCPVDHYQLTWTANVQGVDANLSRTDTKHQICPGVHCSWFNIPSVCHLQGCTVSNRIAEYIVMCT